jgi:hypothetical protein
MSAETEMRAVLAHVRDKLTAAQQQTVDCTRIHSVISYQLPRDVLLTLAYAVGVLDLLITYLKVSDQPQANANGHQPSPPAPKPAPPPAPPPPSTTAAPARPKRPGKPRPWTVIWVHARDGRRRAVGAFTEDMANRTAKTLRDRGHTVEAVRRRGEQP